MEEKQFLFLGILRGSAKFCLSKKLRIISFFTIKSQYPYISTLMLLASHSCLSQNILKNRCMKLQSTNTLTKLPLRNKIIFLWIFVNRRWVFLTNVYVTGIPSNLISWGANCRTQEARIPRKLPGFTEHWNMGFWYSGSKPICLSSNSSSAA